MFSGVCVFSNTSSSASQFLRNVTSGWFLEADQQREINVPLRGHMHVPPLLRRIIDEECDITQKYFRLCRSNCPQLKGMAGEGRGAFRRNLSTLVENAESKAASPDSPTSRADYGSSRLQRGSTHGVYFWMIFDLHFLYMSTSKLNYTGEYQLLLFFSHTLSRSPVAQCDQSIIAVLDPLNP